MSGDWRLSFRKQHTARSLRWPAEDTATAVRPDAGEPAKATAGQEPVSVHLRHLRGPRTSSAALTSGQVSQEPLLRRSLTDYRGPCDMAEGCRAHGAWTWDSGSYSKRYRALCGLRQEGWFPLLSPGSWVFLF